MSARVLRLPGLALTWFWKTQGRGVRWKINPWRSEQDCLTQVPVPTSSVRLALLYSSFSIFNILSPSSGCSGNPIIYFGLQPLRCKMHFLKNNFTKHLYFCPLQISFLSLREVKRLSSPSQLILVSELKPDFPTQSLGLSSCSLPVQWKSLLSCESWLARPSPRLSQAAIPSLISQIKFLLIPDFQPLTLLASFLFHALSPVGKEESWSS